MQSIDVDITSRSVMGVNVPVTNIQMEERSIVDRGYGFSDTTIQLDEAAKKFEESLKYLIELGEVEKTIFLLAEEIESTKRRVNALEHIMIPRFQNTEKYIDMRLQEMERENFVRLKMIRSTIEKNEKNLFFYGVLMKRNPIDQFLADPDNKAKLFRWMTYGMIITTFLITVGFLFFIIHLVGII